MEVSCSLHRIVPTVNIAPDEIVVAQHRRHGLVDAHGLGTRWMRVVPWVGRVDRIMDVATLHHRAHASADEDGAIPVYRRAILRIELAVNVEALGADPAPAGDVAVHDSHILAFSDCDGILVPATESQSLQKHVFRLVQFDEWSLAIVPQHKSIPGDIANPAVGRAGFPDGEAAIEIVFVQHDRLGDGDLAGPGSEVIPSQNLLLAPNDLQFVERILIQTDHAAAIHLVFFYVDRLECLEPVAALFAVKHGQRVPPWAPEID